MNNRILDLLSGLDAYLSDLYEASLAGLAKGNSDISSEEIGAIHALLSSCHETEKGVIVLLRNGFVFDADSLMRSVAEGSVRVLYMLSGSIDCMQTRIKEYMEELPLDTQKNLRKRAVSISDQKEISDEKYREMLSGLESIVTSGTPKEVSSKWSFANLFKHLKNEEWGNIRLSRIQVSYALQSDLLHKGYLTCQLRQESNAGDVGIISRIMFSLYDLADMRCEIITGPSIAAPLSSKHGGVVCQILALNSEERK